MNRILENQWCRFFAGNASIALLTVGIPAAILFQVMGTITSATAGLVILAIVHLTLVGLQISRNGTWIPEKWLAAGYLVLPVIDVSKTVTWFAKGLWVEGFWAFVLAVIAAFVTVSIVKNEHRKWRAPKTTTFRRHRSQHEGNGFDHHADDPTTLVY